MTRRIKRIIVAAVGLAAVVACTGLAYAAMYQADTSAQLRASGQAGELASGYLGVVGSAPASIRAQVDAINIKRRAYYTDLAAKRGVKIEEVGATMACDLFANAVQPGQYYRLSGGQWRKREGSAPVQRPVYCG